MAQPYSPPHRHRHPLPPQTTHPTSPQYSVYSRYWQHRTVPRITPRISICRLPYNRLPFSLLPDPVNFTAGYMGVTTPTMEPHVKSWGQIPRILTLKIATGPDNTGGNPKVGVPVHLHCPCVPCLSSPPPSPSPQHAHTTHTQPGFKR
jgi:hypothetical protein